MSEPDSDCADPNCPKGRPGRGERQGPQQGDRGIWRHPVFIAIVSAILGATASPGLEHLWKNYIAPVVTDPPLVEYSLYQPRFDEGVFVIAPTLEPRIPRDYKPIEPLGSGYAPHVNEPGAHEVYDNFCRSESKKRECDGLVRTHVYTKNGAGIYQDGWRSPVEVAQFFDAGSDGTCDAGQVAIHRFTMKQGETVINTVSSDAPRSPGEWEHAELLGCLKSPPPN